MPPRHPERDPPARVLYDDACRVCTWFARSLRRVDRRGRFEVLGFSEARRRGIAQMIPTAEFYGSFHLLDGDRRWSGSAAVPRVLERLPGGQIGVAVLGRIPGTNRILRVGYDFVARNRHRLGCHG